MLKRWEWPGWRRFLTWLREENEVWGLPVAVGLFFLAGRGLQWLDPTAATFDWGLLQTPLLALSFFLLLKWAVWLMLWLDFPGLYRFLDRGVDGLFSSGCGLSRWQRAVLAAAVYGLYLGLVAWLTVALL